ncbi:hypothetical protein [Dactylosporangium sp. NPDC005555]|uniref:hypothetical protein n=1 Tax=Dactylosporangium sp. NPDC005555 TaxID=3154889 RepID=UPI0033AFA787
MRHMRLGGVGVIDGDRIDWADAVGHPPRSDDRVLSRRRRVVAASIAGAAVAVQAAVALAWWNPWRYVHLMTSTHDWHPSGALAGSVVMLGVAGSLGMRSRTVVRAAVSFAVVVLLAITVLGTLAEVAHNIGNLDRGEGPRVVGISPDGRYEIVVAYAGDLFDADTAVLRVRSRNGLLSRESTDLGCVRPADSDPAVVSVAFTGPQNVMISTGDGRAWQARFDPETLRPTATFGPPCR